MEIEKGKLLVNLAREAIRSRLYGEELKIDENIKRKLSEKKGVFVTLKTYPDRQLRGCIGFPYPILPLWQATIEAAISSAFEDPRFQPLTKEELEKIIIEVTVLTSPRKIEYKDPSELLERIVLGKHGLIVKYGDYSGLLLPQVPVEEGWSIPEFLSYACIKAGLPADAWYTLPVEIYVFEGEIFEEVEPEGEVIKRKL